MSRMKILTIQPCVSVSYLSELFRPVVTGVDKADVRITTEIQRITTEFSQAPGLGLYTNHRISVFQSK